VQTQVQAMASELQVILHLLLMQVASIGNNITVQIAASISAKVGAPVLL
jgi:hypothetical protein